MVITCSFIHCNNKSGHLFPKNTTTRALWVTAVGYTPKITRRSFICSEHFRMEDFVAESKFTGLTNKRKLLKKTAVPTENLGRAIKCKKFGKLLKCKRNLSQTFTQSCDSVEVESVPVLDNEISIISNDQVASCSNVSPSQECHNVETRSVAIQTAIQQRFSVAMFINDNEAIHYYTGLETYAKFKFVLQSLGPNRFQLQYRYWQVIEISLEDQFFITLIKLRRNTPNFELGRLFGVSSACVSNIFITLINFMAVQWKEVDLWATRELVKIFMPEAFKTSFSTTRVIIDGTEVPIMRPAEPQLQQASFSEYKHRNTIKVLVGATPGGLISYCSEAYGGSTSDRQIVERSELRELVEHGDSILADRGFNVQDLFAYKDVTINIPTFLKGKSQLPNVVLTKDREIANKRIHIERLIGLVKTYKILCHTLNKNYTSMGQQIVFFCCMLCNFRSNIVV